MLIKLVCIHFFRLLPKLSSSGKNRVERAIVDSNQNNVIGKIRILLTIILIIILLIIFIIILLIIIFNHN